MIMDYKLNVKLYLKNYFNRTDKKISQRELANKLEVNEVVVSKWLKDGDNAPTLNYVPVIAEILGITIYELLGINDPSTLSSEEKEIIELYRTNSNFKVLVDSAKKLNN